MMCGKYLIKDPGELVSGKCVQDGGELSVLFYRRE